MSAHQPNFFPHLGFFYKVWKSDVFVLLDHVQFAKDDFQSRNTCKVNEKRTWFRVPVTASFPCPINQVKILNEQDWKRKILNTFNYNYRRSAHFEEGMDFLESMLDQNYDMLSILNADVIRDVSNRFGIKTPIVQSSSLRPKGHKSEMLVDLCRIVKADKYLSGPCGASYNDPERFEQAGIELIYSGYKPEPYPQTGEGFIENLSVLDWIFNMGYVLPEGWEND